MSRRRFGLGALVGAAIVASIGIVTSIGSGLTGSSGQRHRSYASPFVLPTPQPIPLQRTKPSFDLPPANPVHPPFTPQ